MASSACMQPPSHPGEPPPVVPARGPPTDWGELVPNLDDRDAIQTAPDELAAIATRSR
jgi:hypothetical protein